MEELLKIRTAFIRTTGLTVLGRTMLERRKRSPRLSCGHLDRRKARFCPSTEVDDRVCPFFLHDSVDRMICPILVPWPLWQKWTSSFLFADSNCRIKPFFLFDGCDRNEPFFSHGCYGKNASAHFCPIGRCAIDKILISSLVSRVLCGINKSHHSCPRAVVV